MYDSNIIWFNYHIGKIKYCPAVKKTFRLVSVYKWGDASSSDNSDTIASIFAWEQYLYNKFYFTYCQCTCVYAVFAFIQ